MRVLNLVLQSTCFVMLGTTFLGCGSNISLTGRRSDSPRAAEYSHIIVDGNPLFFARSDPSCHHHQPSDQFASMKLRVLDHERRRSVVITADLTRSLPIAGNTSGPIAAMHYGAKTIPGLGMRVDPNHPGKTIHFCHPGPYPSRSIENAALISVFGIQQARTIAQRSGLLETLQPIELWVHPWLYANASQGDHRVSVQRFDNAFWVNGILSGASMIAVLPHSTSYSEKNTALLSDQVGVFSHEYGHHLFAKLCPKLSLLQRRPSKAITALNEASADLVASFSFPGEEQRFGALSYDGLWDDRNLFKPAFDNGLGKSITKRTVAHFLVPNKAGKTWSAHRFAAILAHVFRKLLDEHGLDLSFYLKWLEHLEMSLGITKHMNQEQMVEQILRSFITFLPADEETWDIVAEWIPWMDDKW